MIDRAYMGEVLTQVWLDKEVNAQKESLKKYLRGSRKLPQVHEKRAMKMKERKKERKTTCT